MGQFGPHPHCSGFVTVELGFDWPWSWGSTCITSGLGFVAVVVLVTGRIGQSFLILKRLPDIFPALGQWVPAQTGASSKGGGLFSEFGVADSPDLQGYFLGAVAWLHCLAQAWPLLLPCTSLLGLVFFFSVSFWTLFLLGDWCQEKGVWTGWIVTGAWFPIFLPVPDRFSFSLWWWGGDGV